MRRAVGLRDAEAMIHAVYVVDDARQDDRPAFDNGLIAFVNVVRQKAVLAALLSTHENLR